MKTSRGFSIIEIAVVLAVVAMVLVSAVPTMTDWIRNAKLRNQAEAVQTGLQQARAEAVRRNRPITFSLVAGDTPGTLDDSCAVSAAGTGWVVSVRDPAGACDAVPTADTSDTSDPMIVAKHPGNQGSNGVTVAAIDAEGNAAGSITFDAFGRAGAGLRRITVAYDDAQNGDRPLRIDVGPSGMVRMCDTTVSDTSDPRRCQGD